MKLQATTMNGLAFAVIAEISKTTKVVGLAWELTWCNRISNSHSAPHGYLTNWGGKDKDKNGDPAPNGYPGFSGRIWIRYDTAPDSYRGPSANELLRRVHVHPGTGGGGSYDGIWSNIGTAVYRHNVAARQNRKKTVKEVHCYSWDCKIFDYDFPDVALAVKLAHEQECMWATLNNVPLPKAPVHKFTWTDSTTLAGDEAFIADGMETK
jgi:hypothetical protein